MVADILPNCLHLGCQRSIIPLNGVMLLNDDRVENIYKSDGNDSGVMYFDSIYLSHPLVILSYRLNGALVR